MTTDLEDRLRVALHADADRAPLARPEWEGPMYVSAGSSRRHWRRPALAAALVLTIVAGLAAVASTRRDDGAVSMPPTFLAPTFLQGDEYVLERAAARPPERSEGLVDPGSVRAVRPADLDLVVTVFDTAFIHPGALRMRCVEMGAGIACMTAAQRSLMSGDQVDVPGLDQPIGVAVWANVPADAAYVQFVDVDGTARWQRPIDSIAVFRGSGSPTAMRAFDAEGREIDVPSADAGPPWLTTSDTGTTSVAIGRAAAEACLARPGTTWDACVEEGRLAAEADAGPGG